MTQVNLSMKQKHRQNRLVAAKGDGVGGGIEWEFGISRCKLLYIEWINKVILYSSEL